MLMPNSIQAHVKLPNLNNKSPHNNLSPIILLILVCLPLDGGDKKRVFWIVL